MDLGEQSAIRQREEVAKELEDELKFLHANEKKLTKEMRKRRKELKEVKKLANSMNLTM